MQKQLTITLNKKQYSIVTDECHDDVVYAASLVDSLLDQNRLSAHHQEQAFLMIALQLAIDLAKNKRQLIDYEKRVEKLIVSCSP